MKLILIGIGGAIGAVLRYIVSGLDYKFSYGVFPVSTFVINLTGSFIVGLLWYLFDQITVSPNIRMFIFVGILGGFTTFSTFALENFNLLRDGENNIVLLNIVLSNFFSILLVFAGYNLSRYVVGLVREHLFPLSPGFFIIGRIE